MSEPKKSLLTRLIILFLFIGGLHGVSFILSRSMMMTTADIGLFAPVASTSMKPITATLRTKRLRGLQKSAEERLRDGNAEFIVGDQFLTIRAPAAYFTIIATSLPPEKEEQSIGFSMWSKGGDPVAITRAEARLRGCRFGDVSDKCEDNPILDRIKKGEWIVDFELFGVRLTEAEEQRQLGYFLKNATSPDSNCVIQMDDTLGLVTVGIRNDRLPRIPGVDKPPKFCNEQGLTFTGEFRDGVYVPAKHFHKQKPDGSTSWVVQCGVLSPGRNCTMSVRWDGWSGRAIVPADKETEWETVSAAISDFLGRHIVETNKRNTED